MIGYAVLFFGSCLLALIITPLLRRMAVKNGVLDYPDGNKRKIHKEAVPRVGGFAIAISFFISILIAFILRRSEIQESVTHLIALFAGAITIFILAAWDDLRDLSARKKLVGQIVAVLVLMPFGFVIRELNIPFVGVVEVGWYLGALLAIFWIVGITNTINFIDGMDGLAAGIAIIISSTLFIISILSGQLIMALICLALTGSALGFLRYNFHPASIFMGDCGAMFLGFMLAAISVKLLFQSTTIVASSCLPVLIFGLPIVDTSWAIMRRLRRRRSPFHADSFHTHHRLINLGLTQFVAVVILYASSLLCVSAGLIIILIGSEKLAVVIAAFMLVIALVGIIMLGRASPSPESHRSVESGKTLARFRENCAKSVEE